MQLMQQSILNISTGGIQNEKNAQAGTREVSTNCNSVFLRDLMGSSTRTSFITFSSAS